MRTLFVTSLFLSPLVLSVKVDAQELRSQFWEESSPGEVGFVRTAIQENDVLTITAGWTRILPNAPVVPRTNATSVVLTINNRRSETGERNGMTLFKVLRRFEAPTAPTRTYVQFRSDWWLPDCRRLTLDTRRYREFLPSRQHFSFLTDSYLNSINRPTARCDTLARFFLASPEGRQDIQVITNRTFLLSLPTIVSQEGEGHWGRSFVAYEYDIGPAKGIPRYRIDSEGANQVIVETVSSSGVAQSFSINFGN